MAKRLRKENAIILMTSNWSLVTTIMNGNEVFLYIKKHCTEPSLCKAVHKDGGIETLDYILAKKMDFLIGQVCKYISRAGKKDPNKEIEDLKKAQFYLNRKIAELEEQESHK